MQPRNVDLLVVGGGKAGKSLAMDLAAAGQSVAMVERGMIGGTCINVACIPTKTLVNSARLLKTMRRAAEFGITGAESPAIDIDLLRRRKDDVVGTMVAGQRKSFLASGMDLVIGEAKFVADRTVEVALDGGGTRTISGTNVVINTGMVPSLPPIDGLAGANVQTSESILRLQELPASMVVLGGGYIGAEYASMLNLMGVRVTVVQRGTHLLGREDPDVAAAVAEAFTRDGIELRLGVEATRVTRAADGTVHMELSDGGTVSAEDILVALGREPVTAGLGLEKTGVELTPRGFVAVDQHLRTTASGVWAAGDVAGSPQFTHASWNDFRILKANLAGGSLSTKDRLVPYAVFITPELGRVGLTETEARAAGHNVRVARMPVSAIPRARTIGELDGVWTAVVDRDTDLILGAALLSAEASEVIAVVQMVMLGGLRYQQVRDAVITHPTMAEGLQLLLSDAFLE
ncbi:FAD-dependent oxidoreductase [Pseudarthrobacter psychrotolerans]|uniref:FAD-dependent oxidoreductase n=1 Tax=Pseudarthrobacter psychrotolerans TaxID=2697569 RepID=A0A6P1NKD7_9MICC|nr:FAD-dependent oxidoreductase [Pseudarthrobacter psychrotolerans]QHK20049.1 FAD-dependent oxidoreductase [Pseudarthrobacter psychrotolerans]